VQKNKIHTDNRFILLFSTENKTRLETD